MASSSSNKQQDIEVLVSLGFDTTVAEMALRQCGSVEAAASFLFDGASVPSDSVPLNDLPPLKMVIIVRTDLGMSPGKIAAQAVHGALGACR